MSTVLKFWEVDSWAAYIGVGSGRSGQSDQRRIRGEARNPWRAVGIGLIRANFCGLASRGWKSWNKYITIFNTFLMLPTGSEINAPQFQDNGSYTAPHSPNLAPRCGQHQGIIQKKFIRPQASIWLTLQLYSSLLYIIFHKSLTHKWTRLTFFPTPGPVLFWRPRPNIRCRVTESSGFEFDL